MSRFDEWAIEYIDTTMLLLLIKRLTCSHLPPTWVFDKASRILHAGKLLITELSDRPRRPARCQFTWVYSQQLCGFSQQFDMLFTLFGL